MVFTASGSCSLKGSMRLNAYFRINCGIQLCILEEIVPGDTNSAPSTLHSINHASLIEGLRDAAKVRFSVPIPT